MLEMIRHYCTTISVNGHLVFLVRSDKDVFSYQLIIVNKLHKGKSGVTLGNSYCKTSKSDAERD